MPIIIHGSSSIAKSVNDHINNTDIHVTAEDKTTWNSKADAPFKPSGKSYLTFSSPNSFTLAVGDATKHWDGTLEYFSSDKTWTVWDGTTTLSAITDDGEYFLYLRGTGNTVITGDTENYKWVLTGSNISCIGNIENLLDYGTVEAGEHLSTLANYCYAYMFSGCTALIQAPDLPATTLADGCYGFMFSGCTALIQAPALPATTLAISCYAYMFSGCTSLTQAPALPAITLATSCYGYMFSGCTSLTQAPALPATTLATYCYYYMFNNCTSLTQAPALPATTLAERCYYCMFYKCTSLTQAPALPAITLADGCYYGMFAYCASLKLSSTQTGEYIQEYRIPSSGTGTVGTGALTSMFTSTGGTFTGTPEINTTYYLSSDNMVVHETEVATLREYVGSMIDDSVLLKNVAVSLPTIPDAADWQAVTFGNGRFVAIAYNSNIAAYSDDGITWTQAALPASNKWYGIGFGNGRFVAVSWMSNIAAYSNDGITWTQITLPLSSNASWYGVVYGNNRFVAISDTASFAYSDDGITWTQTYTTNPRKWQAVAFGNNRFVAVAGDSNLGAYSDDGITWESISLPSYVSWCSVTFGNGRFVAVRRDSSIVAYSDNGINWTEATLPVSIDGYSVTFGNNRFVAVTYKSTIAAYSDDGITWIQTSLLNSSNWVSVIFGNDRFIAINDKSNIIAYSYDGITWYNTADVLTYPDNTDIKDRIKSVIGITNTYRVKINLPSSSWDPSTMSQTVEVPGVLSDEDKQLITPTPAISSQTSYYDNGLKCSNQGANSLTFVCSTIPTEDLTVYIVIQEV